MYAAKSALDNYISTSLIHMNMPAILGFSHAAQVLYKLSILESPSWDRALCRATVDVLWYFEQAACSMERAAADLSLECSAGDDTVYSQAGPAWRGTAAIWREGLEAATVPPEQSGLGGGENAQAFDTQGFDAMDTTWLSMPDDIWFSNFFPR
jgi:hypothetical protein